ncbi:MAG: alpha/beta hydrolase, partial [Verrucomicrobiota bacterium]|nr:alpha/beta hydrolase [Verrucomicrobiota bacterium]
LKAVLEKLDLQDVTLVGFSMGGGEVARYMSRHGGARVSKVAFVAAVTPFLLKTADNPTAVDQSVFDEMTAGIKKDRAAFMETFGKKFFGVGVLKSPVSDAVLHHAWGLAMKGSINATLDCAAAFSSTDFRKDLATIKVPALIIHGDADQTVPIAASGEQTAMLLPHARFIRYEGAPHGLFVTEKDRLNRDLIEFIK